MSAKRNEHEPKLSRREAFLIALGKSDQVSLEKERQSAIDAARGYEPVGDVPAPAPTSSDDPNPIFLWLMVIALAVVAVAIGALLRQRAIGGWPFSRSTPAPA